MQNFDLKNVLLATGVLSWIPSLLIVFSTSAQAFDGPQDSAASVHEQITKEALSGKICQSNLQVILAGCRSETMPKDEPDAERYRHFRDKNLLKTLNFVEREKRKVLNMCATADVDQKSRVRALYHFGLILHTFQDFYSASNYIELKVDQLTKKHSMPSKDDMYGIPLVDWNALITLLRNGEQSSIIVEEFDKGDPQSAEAQKSINGVTYYAIAKELALRETERQWQQLESLIRARLQTNATAVTVSLKNAGCSDQVVSDVLKSSDTLVPEI